MSDIPLIPAATVVLVCDDPDGIKTLMLRRNAGLQFAGGNWVFPGGRVDDADYAGSHPENPVSVRCKQALAAARNAAIRETQEEAGLDIAPEALCYFSHWVAPALMPKRFSTWFFLATVDIATLESVAIDGGEIHEYRWLTAREVLDGHDEGSMPILPPTLVTLNEMLAFSSCAQLIDHFSAQEAFVYQPKVHMSDKGDGQYTFLYQGDAGYDLEQPDTQGARHRVSVIDGKFTYQKAL